MKNIGIIVVILVIVGGIFVFSKNGEKKEAMKQDVAMEQENNSMVKEGDEVMVKDEVVKEEGAMTKAGTYEAYAPEKIAKAENGDVVLFFKASWCPTCRALDKDIKANLGNIPESLSILDVDYDNSTELKKKYGVTYQHTLVQVDKDGKMLKKWMGSPTLASFVKEVI